MSLSPGTRLGPYEIVAPLGAGGMGEVYRARDTRLARDVAVKVLPERLLENAEARGRFEREARAVAALSHPNILAIHDFGEHEGAAYAVTELLEGETLAERLKAGPLPVRRALELAGQMADGLAAAHEKGIIHRDLKPANLFITTDGRLKILDFGLARMSAAGDDRTQTIALGESTEPGRVLGTVHYMSPEQVRAGVVDHRSDIFSFGVVLYEMLTGKRPFQADSAVETMNAILREEPPDSSSLNGLVPPGVDRIVRRCLEKKPEMRFQSARDLGFALGNTGDSSSRTGAAPGLLNAAEPAAGRPGARPGVPLIAAVALFAAGGGLGALLAGRFLAPPERPPVKITRLTHTGRDWSPTASPDGRNVAFCSDRDGTSRIWLRQMKGGTEVPLTAGSDICPRFSPDGSEILFLRGSGGVREVWRVPVVGGHEKRLMSDVLEAAWAPDGARVAYLRPTGDGRRSLTAIGTLNLQGGQERELLTVEGLNPYGLDWSPDGRWLTVTASGAVNNSGENRLFVVDAQSGKIEKNLVYRERMSMATWDRHGDALVLARSTNFVGDTANPLGRVVLFDPFSGREHPVFWVQSVWTGGTDIVRIDAVGDSSYVFDEYDWRGSLEEYDLATLGSGAPPGTNTPGGRLLTSGSSRDRQPAYSRAGNLVVFSSNRSGNLDLWTINTATGEVRQVTDDGAQDWDPAFTPDGRGILWSSDRGGHLEIWAAATDGTGAHQLSHDGQDAENPTQTADGRYIVYSSGNLAKNGIWRMRADGSEPTRLVPGTFFLPDVSPDGRYVAYALTNTAEDRNELYVAEVESGREVFHTWLPPSGYQAVVQPGRPRWMPDGRSLVFVSLDARRGGILCAQEFRPGENTDATRRDLVTLGGEAEVESFGVAPDGRHVTVARIAQSLCLKLAEGVPGLR